MATAPTNRQLAAKIVTLRLNRQQLELIDRTVARAWRRIVPALCGSR
jgi:hypothetical protein